MSHYEVLPISVPVSHEDLEKYKAIRLAALKTNPEAFGSNYQRAIERTSEEWREVIDGQDRATFVVVDQRDGSWVGLVLFMAPEVVEAKGFATPRKPGEHHFILIQMWVNLAHRRKGLAARLIEAGKEWSRDWIRDSPLSGAFAIALEVGDDNPSALRLYRSCGFKEITDGGSEGDRGPVWMKFEL